MKKIYKIRSPLRYLLINVIFVLSSVYISLHEPFVQVIVLVYVIFVIWYVFSHKFVLDYSSREIVESFFGLGIKKLRIDDIKEYYIHKTEEKMIIKGQTINCLVSLRLNSSSGEILKEVLWSISTDQARDMLSEAKKINNNIICADKSFYESQLYKTRKLKYLIFILIPLVLIFIGYFIYYLNQSLNPF
jgi:hypothetical protein